MSSVRKLSRTQVADAKRRRKSGESLRSIASDLGVSHVAVSKATAGYTTEVVTTGLVELTEHERLALLRILGEMSAGPGFQERWSGLDVQQVAFALRRVSGVDLVG